MSLDKLSTLEVEKLKEFRSKVAPFLTKDAYKEDHFLVRYLLARELNVEKAEQMLKESLKWREENGADDFVDTSDIPEKFRKRSMVGYCGEDEDGFPILLVPAGRHDYRLIIDEVGMERSLRWNIIWIEKMMQIIDEARKKSGKPIYQFHEIVDMEGYSIRQLSYKPSIDYIMTSQNMFDANYPEIIRSIIVINAPKMFPMLFNLVKPLMTKHMLEKIQIYGKNEEEWIGCFKEKRFPLEKFPPRWGGTLKGEDEFCSTEAIWLDAPIPLRYFKEVEGEDEEGFTTVKVGAREKFKLDIPIEEKGTKLEWKFQTELHDIGFGILFEVPGLTDIPVERVGSQKEMQQGEVTCGAKGKCTFVFDNKFSLATPKTLRYRIDLLPPKSL